MTSCDAQVIHRRLVLARDRSSTLQESVFCPARGRSVAAAVCKTCVHAHSVSLDAVVCTPPAPSLPSGADAPAAVAALPRVTLVRADVPGAVLVGTINESPWRLPVVDDEGRFVGFLSPDALRGPEWPWRRLALAKASELVSGGSLLVREEESLGRSLRVMARRGARALALIEPSGVLQGVLRDVDALRALARAGA
jgi:CBS domain-containing protein